METCSARSRRKEEEKAPADVRGPSVRERERERRGPTVGQREEKGGGGSARLGRLLGRGGGEGKQAEGGLAGPPAAAALASLFLFFFSIFLSFIPKPFFSIHFKITLKYF